MTEDYPPIDMGIVEAPGIFMDIESLGRAAEHKRSTKSFREMEIAELRRSIGRAAWWDSLTPEQYRTVANEIMPIADHWRKIWEEQLSGAGEGDD